MLKVWDWIFMVSNTSEKLLAQSSPQIHRTEDQALGTFRSTMAANNTVPS